jgi:phosphocarrier protein
VQTAEVDVTVLLDAGLHARPAAAFVRTAAAYGAAITVQYGARSASAKSIMGVLSLGVRKGATIRLKAEGPDARAALAALVSLLSTADVQEA